MTFKTRMSVLVLSTPVLAFVLVGGLMGADQAQSAGQQTYQHLRVFDEVVDLVLNNYVGDRFRRADGSINKTDTTWATGATSTKAASTLIELLETGKH